MFKTLKRRNLLMLYILLCSFICSAQIFAETPEIKSITLQEARSMALKHNLSSLSAQQMKESAELQRKAAFTRFFPSFNLAGTYMQKGDVYKVKTELYKLPVYSVNSSTGEVAPVAGQFVPFQLDLKIDDEDAFIMNASMSQPLFMGGKVLTQYKLSQNIEKIEKEKLKLSDQEIIVKTDEAYWRTSALNEKYKLAQQYYETVNQHYLDLLNYKAVGIITNNELLKVKIKLNEAELNLLKAKNGLALSEMALNQILGNDLQSEIVLSDSLEKNQTRDFSAINKEQSLKNRPELAMLKTAVDIAGNHKSLQRSRFMPNIVLNASYNWMNPNPYNTLKDETGSDWTISVLAQMELFHWGENRYMYQSAKKIEQSAQFKYDESRELIQLEMQQVEFNLKESHQKVVLCQSSLDQATENLNYTNDQFKQGMLKSADVLDAQTSWQKAKSEYIDALSEYHVSQTKFEKAFALIQ